MVITSARCDSLVVRIALATDGCLITELAVTPRRCRYSQARARALSFCRTCVEGQQIIWRSFELGNQVLKNGPSASASEIVDGIEAQAMTILHC